MRSQSDDLVQISNKTNLACPTAPGAAKPLRIQRTQTEVAVKIKQKKSATYVGGQFPRHNVPEQTLPAPSRLRDFYGNFVLKK